MKVNNYSVKLKHRSPLGTEHTLKVSASIIDGKVSLPQNGHVSCSCEHQSHEVKDCKVAIDDEVIHLQWLYDFGDSTF